MRPLTSDGLTPNKFVSAETGNDANSGNAANDAYATIQKFIDVATAGDICAVDPSTKGGS